MEEKIEITDKHVLKHKILPNGEVKVEIIQEIEEFDSFDEFPQNVKENFVCNLKTQSPLYEVPIQYIFKNNQWCRLAKVKFEYSTNELHYRLLDLEKRVEKLENKGE